MPVQSPTRVWFARHGEVEAGRVGSFIGRTDVTLSPLGRHQAEAIAAYLEDSPLDAIVTSPRRRALETVAPLARAKNLTLDVRAGLAEMDFGEWDGLHWHEIVERDSQHAMEWQADVMQRAAPGGESGTQFARRVQQTLDEVLEEFKGRMVLVGGHAGTNRAIFAKALGIPYVQAFAFAQDYGCLNATGWGEGFAQVALANFVPGPRSEDQGEGKREVSAPVG